MKTIALVLNIINLVALLPSLGMAMMSPMLFDSGATTRTWVIFYTVIAIPLTIIITQIFAWIFYKKGNFQWTIGVSIIPLIVMLFLGVLFTISDSLT